MHRTKICLQLLQFYGGVALVQVKIRFIRISAVRIVFYFFLKTARNFRLHKSKKWDTMRTCVLIS